MFFKDAMRKPETIETLYLDFDGFFASVEQQANARLRGRPVGVVPFEGTDRTAIIACSREAKLRGVKSVMPVREARMLCPDLVLVPQRPDLYRRAHNALLAEIQAVIPIDAVKSIDELACRLDGRWRANPDDLSVRIKDRILRSIGPYITASLGFAANRQLAKMACKAGKMSNGVYGNGLTIWRPQDLPGPLFDLSLADIPGIGSSMERRLCRIGIQTTEQLYRTSPKHMRRISRNVTGERLWYALHGYDVQAPPAQRGMFGHGRVLPPENRSLSGAYAICRLLLTKAARRLRRSGFYCAGLWLWLSLKDGPWDGSWSAKQSLPIVHDDQAILAGLGALWSRVRADYPRGAQVFRVGVTLMDLSPASERQLDMLLLDDVGRRKWENVTAAVDQLNAKYGRTVMSLGIWRPPSGGNAGGKISYTRIPSAEDFW